MFQLLENISSIVVLKGRDKVLAARIESEGR